MIDTKEFASSPEFFEAKYQSKSDPWRFSTDTYELQRYQAIMAALGPGRYRHAYEPGCSIGVLTERLAAVCDAVESIDFSPTASARARLRCERLPHVQVRCAAVPEANPPVGYDLLVLSEIGYYFDVAAWTHLVTHLIASMPQGGTVLAAHWLGSSNDHRITGDQVHAVLLSHPQLRVQHSERNALLRVDRMVRL